MGNGDRMNKLAQPYIGHLFRFILDFQSLLSEG